MRQATAFVVVLVTAPELKTARALARMILRRRLAACVNLIPKVESHYWWKNRLESGAEVLLLVKTTKKRLAALERLVMTAHPYDTPEFISLPVASGSTRFLKWLAAACARPGRAGDAGGILEDLPDDS